MNFYVQKNIINCDEKEVYQWGVLLVLNDIVTFSLILLLRFCNPIRTSVKQQAISLSIQNLWTEQQMSATLWGIQITNIGSQNAETEKHNSFPPQTFQRTATSTILILILIRPPLWLFDELQFSFTVNKLYHIFYQKAMVRLF